MVKVYDRSRMLKSNDKNAEKIAASPSRDDTLGKDIEIDTPVKPSPIRRPSSKKRDSSDSNRKSKLKHSPRSAQPDPEGLQDGIVPAVATPTKKMSRNKSKPQVLPSPGQEAPASAVSAAAANPPPGFMTIHVKVPHGLAIDRVMIVNTPLGYRAQIMVPHGIPPDTVVPVYVPIEPYSYLRMVVPPSPTATQVHQHHQQLQHHQQQLQQHLQHQVLSALPASPQLADGSFQYPLQQSHPTDSSYTTPYFGQYYGHNYQYPPR